MSSDITLYEESKFDVSIVVRAVGVYLEIYTDDGVALCSRALSLKNIESMIEGLKTVQSTFK